MVRAEWLWTLYFAWIINFVSPSSCVNLWASRGVIIISSCLFFSIRIHSFSEEYSICLLFHSFKPFSLFSFMYSRKSSIKGLLFSLFLSIQKRKSLAIFEYSDDIWIVFLIVHFSLALLFSINCCKNLPWCQFYKNILEIHGQIEKLTHCNNLDC